MIDVQLIIGFPLFGVHPV